MTLPVSFPATFPAQAQTTSASATVSTAPRSSVSGQDDASGIGQRFEQMLWTEMLTYAGLDEAFSQGGGEAASSFSRFLVEAVAKDLAESHPLGLGEAVDRSIAAQQDQQQDT